MGVGGNQRVVVGGDVSRCDVSCRRWESPNPTKVKIYCYRNPRPCRKRRLRGSRWVLGTPTSVIYSSKMLSQSKGRGEGKPPQSLYIGVLMCMDVAQMR